MAHEGRPAFDRFLFRLGAGAVSILSVIAILHFGRPLLLPPTVAMPLLIVSKIVLSRVMAPETTIFLARENVSIQLQVQSAREAEAAGGAKESNQDAGVIRAAV